jgi:AcrR family transcriptional regulator
MPTQAERTRTTRRALVDAGLTLFSDPGYAEVGVDEIAGRAGVTSGALYHHFDSKAGLFRAVYDELVEGTNSRIAAARAANPAPSLVADCEVYLDACSDASFFRITAVAPSVIGWDLILDDTQELIAASLRAAKDAGEIDDDLPIPATARMVAAALKEAGVMIATAGDPTRARAEASETARRLIAGLTRRSA